MSPYTWACSRLLFPLHESIKKHDTVRVRRELEASQWWSADRLRQLQAERLRAFLTDIGARVPYYGELFARLRFDPASVRSVDDLRRLPRLEKADIRRHVERLKAPGASGLSRFTTGGSSGEPLTFFTTRARRSHDVAAKWRATRWWGVDIGDPEIVVWGSPIEIGAQDRLRELRDRLMRSYLLPAFDMSPASLEGYVRFIRERRPAMVFGYPSSLSLIADFAAGQGVRLDDLGTKVVFVTSERLYDHQRAAIERGFGCSVANGYGGRDAGFIAHQCPSGGMHVSAEDIVVEILREDGEPAASGEAGEIVVTHMSTGDFPFVRYRTGDVGALEWSGCGCGRGLPLLAQLQGRTTDFVVAHDGTVMHGLALIYVLREIQGIEHFRIVQESLERTDVLIVAGAGFDPASVERIRAGLRRRLGSNVAVTVDLVDSIPREKSGKYRYVVSKVSPAGLEPPVAVRAANG